MAGRQCGMPGCGRFVRAGETWCGRHQEDGGEEPVGAPAGAEFRRRLQAASYRELFGAALVTVLAQAAAERPLADEIGALRVTLARLLVEEEDVGKLATSVARVAAVAVQAARVQSALGMERPEDVAAEIVRTLEELGKG
ncbi:MAG: hypothetical protein M3464_00810 [Chloroflexota bacterium]|nr:hypothetical protein [Chloroflexota bacterium]